ncbi:hypothetical protein [Ruminococcus albus]|uniref:Uncharacterized protein n=1 Tax=Ruminococcus albus TaxID=1264 RepID=A0A1H7HYQ4_RUMAL|nr:hypothetical protein [Ruminococcus albus]SEK55298.1 hypothetical protein SAMN05216469_103159 [Ruminococcus albus]
MEDLHECWMTMPDEDLADIYRKRLREQKRMARMTFIPLLPALVIYGFIGWTSFLTYEQSGFVPGSMNFTVGRAFYYIGFAISGAMISTATIKRRWLIFIPTVLTLPFVIFLFNELSAEIFLMLCYLLYVYFRLGNVLSDLDLLRSLPRFPFDKHSADRDLRIMNSKDAERYIDLASGKAVATGYESIFTDKVELPKNSGH